MARHGNFWPQAMAVVAGLLGAAKSDSLKDVEHVVLFMQGKLDQRLGHIKGG